jgi:hypothetical protein
MITCLLGAVMVLHAQKDTRSIPHWGDPVNWQHPIFCDGLGTLSDWVGGVLTFHQVFHVKDGKPQWFINQVKGDAVSYMTGETFKYKEIAKMDLTEYVKKIKFVLKGDNGTKYIGTYTIDYKTWDFTIKINCK